MSDPMLVPLYAVLIGWMVAGGSPGPATLAITGTSMQQGWLAGLTLAAGLRFSWAPIAGGYARAKRGFEVVFGLLFGTASFKILTARLQ